MIDARRGSRGTADADRIAAGRTPDAGDPARRGAGASGLPIVPATTIDAAAAVVAVAAADRLGSNHPVDVYVQRLRTAVSRQTTERKLDMVARVLDELWPGSVQLEHLRGERFGVPWLALTPVACERLRNALADRWAPATANAALAAIRGVLRAAWLAGAFDADGRDRLFEGLRAVHGDRVYVKRSTTPSPATGEDVAGATAVSPAGASSPTLSPALLEAWMDDEAPGEVGRHLEPAEIERLWSCAADDPKAARGARNLAVLALLYGCGLRAGEAVALTLADVDTAEEPSVRVFGKGRKRRTVPIPPAAVTAIQRWIVVRGHAPGPLLLPVLKNNTLLVARAGGQPARLSPQALTNACLFMAEAAGVAPFRAHDLRRTFAGQHLDAGNDIATVAQLMGHANVTTTSRYDRRPDRARREAQGRLWVPEMPARDEAATPHVG